MIVTLLIRNGLRIIDVSGVLLSNCMKEERY